MVITVSNLPRLFPLELAVIFKFARMSVPCSDNTLERLLHCSCFGIVAFPINIANVVVITTTSTAL